MTISLDLTGDAERKLAEIANRLHLPGGDPAAAADFEKAARHVLVKNEALYRRLV